MLQDARTHTQSGSIVGERYVLGEVLDETPAYRDFLAEDTRLGRTVAVRMLRKGLDAESSAAKRLVREARVAAMIGHPNVREPTDIGQLEGGVPFVVSEHLPGETLEERIRVQGGLVVASALDIVAQMLSGVAAVHARGILHTALGPEHVFLAHRLGCPPLVKIGGFASALLPNESTRLDEIVRTASAVHYLAPEQVRRGRTLGPTADVYACGAILYETLTGRRPFTAPDSAALLQEIATAPLRSPSTLRPELSATVTMLVERAMRRDPRDRFQTAQDMQRAVQAAMLEGDLAQTYAATDEKSSAVWDDKTARMGEGGNRQAPRDPPRPAPPSYGGESGEESVTILLED